MINANVVGGIEWSRQGSSRRFRFLVNYYHGFNPYGQFFAQKSRDGGIWVPTTCSCDREPHRPNQRTCMRKRLPISRTIGEME